MWSVGVLTYVLLSGLNPFAAESITKMIENISNAEYIFDSEAFKETSLEGMDFCDRLLCKDLKKRMTAHEALEHPWLRLKLEYLSKKTIKTLRHRRYYQTLVKKERETIVSAARVAFGGGYRSYRGYAVGKVKIAHPTEGLRAGPVMHGSSEEGGHVRFVCNIENYDETTKATWYFGTRQLTASHKYEISYINGVASIYVKEIETSDDGVYRCKVISQDGEDNFTLPLYNRAAYIGEDVRFGVTITVHPEPTVTWLKAGQKIKRDDKKYTFISDKGLYQLMIHNLDLDDDSEYTVMAHNKFGEDSCTARLTVTPHPVRAPRIEALPEDITIELGKVLTVACAFSGEPTPNIEWSRGGRTLPGEDSLCVGGLGSVCYIWSISPLLSGVLCEFKHALSLIKHALSLTEEAIFNPDIAMRTHYIIKAKRGVITVPLDGRPAPSATWMFREENIDNNTKYEFHHTDTTSTLVIPEVGRNDTGKYTVKFENGVGEPKSMTLSVKVQDSPAACTNLVLKDVTRGKVIMCWEESELDGGADITNYIIEKRDSSNRSYSNLSEKTSFFFCVSAENEFGIKEVAMKDASKTSVTLHWVKPDYDGGSIISDYVIEKRLKDEEETDYRILGHLEELEYQFRVFAQNDAGFSRKSDESNTTMAVSPVGKFLFRSNGNNHGLVLIKVY
uniref:Uncharacterized protein n=1 Tax=Hucho hucho TaxID=62062 RepID=A0A4W5NY67_9TELE